MRKARGLDYCNTLHKTKESQGNLIGWIQSKRTLKRVRSGGPTIGLTSSRAKVCLSSASIDDVLRLNIFLDDEKRRRWRGWRERVEVEREVTKRATSEEEMGRRALRKEILCEPMRIQPASRGREWWRE